MRGSATACGSARIPTGVLATVTAVVALMLVPMAGQAQTVAAYTWTAPRTPWGDPDLQGQIRTTVGVHAHQPGVLHQTAVSVQVLSRRAGSVSRCVVGKPECERTAS